MRALEWFCLLAFVATPFAWGTYVYRVPFYFALPLGFALGCAGAVLFRWARRALYDPGPGWKRVCKHCGWEDYEHGTDQRGPCGRFQ